MEARVGETALLVGVEVGRGSLRLPGAGSSTEESLEELGSLARSAGATVAGLVAQFRSAFDPSTLIGKGKLEEISRRVTAEAVDVVIFDHDLSPTQQRNLERALDCKVIDRTQLILDIFARRARTREGKLQVELAQLDYLLPRLAGRGTAMSRLGGGIGTRGPGETQLETDRRKVRRRIQKIQGDLENVRRNRTLQRSQRTGIPLASVALVGYTNAGKSTLFNRLTGAAVTADARLFATLDPTARVLALPSQRRVILSDTVGFIRRLPTTLVKAFRATLEEVREAALLLHVVDAAAAEAEVHISHVQEVLGEIDAAGIPQLLVWNKIDEAGAATGNQAVLRRAAITAGAAVEDGAPAAVPRGVAAVSARTGEGVGRLLALIDELLPVDRLRRIKLRVPSAAGGTVHLVHEFARVVSKEYDGDDCVIEANVPESLLRRLEPYVVKNG